MSLYARARPRSTGAATLALLMALAGLAVASHAQPADAASKKSCTRGKAKLVFRAGDVQVLGIRLKTKTQGLKRTRLVGCWAPSGKRFTLFIDRDEHGPTPTSSHLQHQTFQVVNGRYLGVLQSEDRVGATGPVSPHTAQVFDVKDRKLLHESSHCSGMEVQEVAFLPAGGLAYACPAEAAMGGLWLATAKGDTALEPGGTDVRNLAVSSDRLGGFDAVYRQRLYWTVVSGATTIVRSTEL